MRPLFRPAACLAVLSLLAGCHRGGVESSGPAAGPRVTDGNVVAIVLAANSADLSYARLVAARSRNTEVRELAQRMTTDHTILNQRAIDIAQRNGIRPEEDEISLEFRDRSAQQRDVLRELTGTRFDSAYAENEVQYHTELLATLNGVLGPQARNAELREFVMSVKPAASAHLAHAEQVRANLARKK